MAVQQTLRPYVTAGIAIVGCGLIAATPVAAPSANSPTMRQVALAGLPDLLAPWTPVWNQASENITTILQNYYLAPGVAFQQMMANGSQYLQSILDDPSTIPTVVQQLQHNIDSVLTGYTLQDASAETIATVNFHTLSGSDLNNFALGHDLLFQLLPQFLDADTADAMGPIINYMASPASAMLMGFLGPSLSPWVALMNSIQGGDSFSEIMASPLNGWLNGATLDLSFLIPLIAGSGLLPEGTEITHLDFAVGGLLSTGSVSVGPYQVTDQAGNLVDVPAVGGSMFNSLGISLQTGILPGVPLEIASHGVGPIAALQAWGQTVGALLGSGWTGKGPVEVSPPWPGISFPTLPDDLFDDGGAGSSASTDFAADLAGFFGFGD
ncbi:outer membrane porin GjpA [Mycolicibacter minnesotensis]